MRTKWTSVFRQDWKKKKKRKIDPIVVPLLKNGRPIAKMVISVV